MPNVAVVTDTSADLLPEEAEALGVGLVPLTVSFDDESFAAGTELTNEDFYQRLTAPGAPFPRTAAPNPPDFEAVCRGALEHGADGVVCITISSKMSATYQSAVSAAEAIGDGVVRVIDSGTTTHALGLIVRAAAERAGAGASIEEVVDVAEDQSARSRIFFVVDTLEYLQRGGRIGRASAVVGSLLSIKPILTVDDGEVAAADRRRTMAKARLRLLELVSEAPVERAVALHTMTDGIEGFAEELAQATGIDAGDLHIGITGPIAGTHVGPGIFGAALVLRE